MWTSFSTFLLERPLRLFLVGCGLQFLLICFWSWRRSPFSARAIWTGFISIPLLLGLSVLVVTSREHVIEVCESLARAIDRGDLPAVADRLDADFRAAEWDRDAFIERARSALREYRFQDVRLSGFEFRRSDDTEMEIEFDAKCRVQSTEVNMDLLLTRWRLLLRRRESPWRIIGMEPVATPFSPIRGWRDGSR